MRKIPRLIIDRYWKRVKKEKDGCWVWLAAKTKDGYGRVGGYKNRKEILAHRLSWIIVNGKIPRGMLICHHRDNPPCVNPIHLFLGTQQDNVNDAVKKGRIRPRGRIPHSSIPRSIKNITLKEKDRDEIRRLVACGVKRCFLIKKYGTSYADINLILQTC